MSTIPKSYKKHIAEGKGILIFSILFATIIRIIYFLYFNPVESGSGNGYLWQILYPLFGNPLISLVSSSLCIAILAVLTTHINTEHAFIRRRSILPPSIIILLFSCHPSFIIMSPAYIGALIFLFIISILFASYNQEIKQIPTFKVSFLLALASLFEPVLLIYLPTLWIALGIMRCFNTKSFLASIVGVFIVYFPTYSYFLFTDNINSFLAPFTSIEFDQLGFLETLATNIHYWIILVFALVLLIIIISSNYINRHLDKIKNRAYSSLLNFITVSAILILIFLNISPKMSLFIVLSTGSLSLAHFFALVEHKGGVILFYISVIFYILVCFTPFLSF